jgi:hypothetical protein
VENNKDWLVVGNWQLIVVFENSKREKQSITEEIRDKTSWMRCI